MQYIQILKLVLTLFPLLVETVKAIEAAIPQGGQGQAKLEAVRVVLESAYKTANDATVAFEALWPMLSQTVTAIVAMLNATGQFKVSVKQ